MNGILQTLAGLLPHEDREVVLGDLCESGLTPMGAVIDLCGLILRRTLQPYTSWRPWVCLGIALPMSFLLIGIGVALAVSSKHDNAASAVSLFEILRLGLLLLITSALSSFAAVKLSRATPVPLGLIFLLASLDCFHKFRIVGVTSLSVFFFLPPLVFGAWLAYSNHRVPHIWTAALPLLLLLLLGPSETNNSWAWFNNLLLLMPATYCAATASWRRQNVL